MTVDIQPMTPGAPPPPDKKQNVFERIAGVLFAPADTFQEIVRRPDHKEVVDEREPRPHERAGPTRVSRVEQPLAVIDHLVSLPVVTTGKYPQELRINAGAPAREVVAFHTRWGRRKARLARA